MKEKGWIYILVLLTCVFIRLHIPVGYHGRASSIVVSGTDLHRPAGQRITPQNKTEPFFAPSAKLDYELEVVSSKLETGAICLN